jgi:fluoroquinolone resistance protein
MPARQLVVTGLLRIENMEQVFIEEATFDKLDFTQNPLSKGRYEYCTFVNCNFSNSDLSNFKFLECEFLGCNLSLSKLNQTALQDVRFKDCKMLGLDLGDCHEFGFSVSFDRCILNHTAFVSSSVEIEKRVKLRHTTFKDSTLQEVDFTKCDLSSAIFDNCDLSRAIFENTMIEKADFRTAFNYAIDPELNRIKKAKFSQVGVAGLLGKYDIEIEGTD